ncbi:MAG: phosphopantetheine-binding protein [Lentimicrobiaceae bacterium]|jgi:acyl carrier protein|nr:phosphopantetheine-binding protein [Lentimicrobiaceae bacterium]
MEELINKLKEQIITELNLEDIKPEDIKPDTPLFGDEGLGLDSIDALELIVLLEKNYGIKIEDPKDGKKIFYSIRTLAEYITENQSKI